MDPQRPYPGDSYPSDGYPSEADRWYAERGGDDPGRVPPQRGGDQYRYPDPGRPEQPYVDPDYGNADVRLNEPDDTGFDFGRDGRGDTGRRRPAVRPQRHVGKRSGLEMPDPPAEYADDQQRYRAERIDREALRRPDPPAEVAEPAPGATYQAGAVGTPTQAIAAPTAVYLSKRPGLRVLIALVAIVAEVILFKQFATGFLAHNDGANVLGPLFAMVGTPLVGVGLYALATGAATAAGPHTGRAWLRTPLAYLPVGLILVIAAGLAV